MDDRQARRPDEGETRGTVAERGRIERRKEAGCEGRGGALAVWKAKKRGGGEEEEILVVEEVGAESDAPPAE